MITEKELQELAEKAIPYDQSNKHNGPIHWEKHRNKIDKYRNAWMEGYKAAEQSRQAAVSGTGVSWQYFFGSPGYRYYKAEINGLRVERLNSRYAIGNIDEASQTFKTEAELIAACSSPDR